MAKFKRLSRFLQRIGIKKKQRQNDSVNLARRSWNNRLLKMLKIKPRRSHNGGNHDDHGDAAAAAVDSISDSPQCSGVVSQLIVASPIEEESCHWEAHCNTIVSASSSCSDLTSVTELSDYQVHKGEISLVSSELTLTDVDDQDTSSTITISITSIEEFFDAKSNVSVQFEDVYQSAEPACTVIQPRHDDNKELFDEDEKPQRNTIDDDRIVLMADWLPVLVIIMIIIINTLLVSSVLTLFIYLLYLM